MDLVWMLAELDVADCVAGSQDNLVPGTEDQDYPGAFSPAYMAM